MHQNFSAFPPSSPQEESMEDILASIRRLVYEGQESPEASGGPATTSPSYSPPSFTESSDIIDLLRPVAEDVPLHSHAPSQKPSSTASSTSSQGAFSLSSGVLHDAAQAVSSFVNAVAKNAAPGVQNLAATPSAESTPPSPHPAGLALEELVKSWAQPLLEKEIAHFAAQQLEAQGLQLLKPLMAQALQDYIAKILPELLRAWMETHLASMVVQCVENQLRHIHQAAVGTNASERKG